MIKRGTRKIAYRILAAFMAIVLLWADFGVLPGTDIELVSSAKESNNVTLSIGTAISLALANSSKLEELDMKLDTKYSELSSAVRSIAIKRKQMRSLKWSPLLSFKLPQTPNEATEYNFTYRPLTIQGEINKLYRQINDQEITETEKVYQNFVKIYVLQDKIKLNEERVESMKDSLAKNQARLAKGFAKKGDVDSIEKSIESVEKTIAKDKKSLDENKEKLSKLIKLDVKNGYDFANPYVKTEIPRSELDSMIRYTLDYDSNYYSVCQDTTLSYESLELHYRIYNKAYKKDDMNIIRSYVTTALAGGSISKKAFKQAYKDFTTAIDRYWEGYFRILFFKIPRRWLKDEEEDGTGYLSDDPEALYTATIEYMEKLKEKEDAKEELISQVTDEYNNYMAMKDAYETALEQVAIAEEELAKAKVLNQTGRMDFTEYDTFSKDYEDAELAMYDSLADYSSAIYTLNRQTCGWVMMYLQSLDPFARSAEGGRSYVELTVDEDSAYYFLEPIVQNSEFELHVFVPEHLGIAVSHYELWVGNVQIGERTKLDEGLRHLSLDLNGDESVFIRLYNGNTLVDNCEIDPYRYSGNLSIVIDEEIIHPDLDILGSYRITKDETDRMSILSFTFEGDEKPKYYRIKDNNGKYLKSVDMVGIAEPFTYLGLLENSLPELTIEFYDASKTKVCEATFDTSSRQIVRKE